MVKPQFEVGRERLGAGGVVRDPALRESAVLTVAEAAVARGLRVRAVVASPLPGPHGNVEYFLWTTAPGGEHDGRSRDPSDGAADAAGVGGTGQDEGQHEGRHEDQHGAGTDLRALVRAAVAAGPTGDGPTSTSGGGP
jgi:23S rRNA (cytidine1920-2'-O)/16S rRNA (cytidine1409-2'-O)-methyltransferase